MRLLSIAHFSGAGCFVGLQCGIALVPAALLFASFFEQEFRDVNEMKTPLQAQEPAAAQLLREDADEDASFLQLSTKVPPHQPDPAPPRPQATMGLHHSMLQRQMTVAKKAAEVAPAPAAAPACACTERQASVATMAVCTDQPAADLGVASHEVPRPQERRAAGQEAATGGFAARRPRPASSFVETDADVLRRRAATVAAAILGFGLLQQTGLKSAIMLAL